MGIEKLVVKIVPPKDYELRNGFTNIPLINALSDTEKKQLEDALIQKLVVDQDVDSLIVEALAYLKSQKAITVLENILNKSTDSLIKIMIAASIFEINSNDKMIDLAIEEFRKLDDSNNPYYVYTLPSAFFYLKKFESIRVNALIEAYVYHKEYLIAYNAKQVLGVK